MDRSIGKREGEEKRQKGRKTAEGGGRGKREGRGRGGEGREG